MSGKTKIEAIEAAATRILHGVQGREDANFSEANFRNFCEHLTKHAERIQRLEEQLSEAPDSPSAQIAQFQLKKEKTNARKQVSLVAPQIIDENLLEKLKAQRDHDFEIYNRFISEKKLQSKEVFQRYHEFKSEHHQTSDRSSIAKNDIEQAACLYMKFSETDVAAIAVHNHLKFLGKPEEIIILRQGARTDIKLDSAYLREVGSPEIDTKLCYPEGWYVRYARPFWDKQDIITESQARVAERVLHRHEMYKPDGKLNEHKIACLEDDAWDKLEAEIKSKTTQIKEELLEGKHLHKWNPFRQSAPTHKLVEFAMDKGSQAVGVVKAAIIRRVAIASAVILGFLGLEKKIEQNHDRIIANEKTEVVQPAQETRQGKQEAPRTEEQGNAWRDKFPRDKTSSPQNAPSNRGREGP